MTHTHTAESCPFARFDKWYDEAKASSDIKDYTAATLATADGDGQPDARVVLLKAHDERGFTFFTNYQSKKSRELQSNPKAAFVFYWPTLDKQVRILGEVEQISDEESDAYFACRTREKRISAWASHQSQEMEKPTDFATRVQEMTEKFDGQDVPRPEFWGGWRLVPHTVEFWLNQEHRRHERTKFTREKLANQWGQWQHSLLYP